ncbi:ras guanine nucleotide exchange factor domain-containing protein [Spinellus fusiger]|nr:ras guanine nucleotide exchange factor domain-containing protein [Spinellus fusiger]
MISQDRQQDLTEETLKESSFPLSPSEKGVESQQPLDTGAHWIVPSEQTEPYFYRQNDLRLSMLDRSESESEDDFVSYSVNDSIHSHWKHDYSETPSSYSSAQKIYLENIMSGDMENSPEKGLSLLTQDLSIEDPLFLDTLRSPTDLCSSIHKQPTWTNLLYNILLAIQDLKTALAHVETTSIMPLVQKVTDTIRLMLLSSNAMDKESNHMKESTSLRVYYRSMMASMSKLTLSVRICSDKAEETIQHIETNANELMKAAHLFVATSQSLNVPIVPVEDFLNSHLVNDTSATSNSTKEKGLLDDVRAKRIKIHGSGVKESINNFLASLTTKDTPQETRDPLATILFSHITRIVNQMNQFSAAIDDTDFERVADNLEITHLNKERQIVVNKFGLLFCYLQTLTNEDEALERVIQDMSNTARAMEHPIDSICHYITVLSIKNYVLVESPLLLPSTDSTPHSNRPDRSIQSTGTQNEKKFNTKNRRIEGSLKIEIEIEIEIETETETETEKSLEDDDDEEEDDESPVFSDEDPEFRLPRQYKNNTTRHNTQTMSRNSLNRMSSSTKTQSIHSSAKLKRFFGDDAPLSPTEDPTMLFTECPWYLEPDYDANEVVFTMENSIKGGTLRALIVLLTMHNYLDLKFIKTFLLTYRSYCSTSLLFDSLEARYNIAPPDNLSDEEYLIWGKKKLQFIRLRVSNVLMMWLEKYYSEEDADVLDRLLDFVNRDIRVTLSFSAEQLERLIIKRKQLSTQPCGLRKLILTKSNCPFPIVPRNLKRLQLADIDALEMARQLTIMDFKLYSNIPLIECLDKAWSRDPGGNKSVAINIRSSIEYCNNVTAYVTDAILSQIDVKKRSLMIKYWVLVAERCRYLNNFNTCMAILSAFDNSAIGRLSRSWELVGTRIQHILACIRKLMGTDRNFNEYRVLTRTIHPPCIPFLGIYLQDLTFFEDGNPHLLKSSKNLINFAKQAKIADVIEEIRQYQLVPYQLKTINEIQLFIQINLKNTRDEDALYLESLRLEPKERNDEKVVRTLQESGFL